MVCIHLEITIFYCFGKFQVLEFVSCKNEGVLQVANMALAHLHIKQSSLKSISVIPKNLVTIDFEKVCWKCIVWFRFRYKKSIKYLDYLFSKTNLFLNELMFKWPIIVLLAFFTLCCLIFLMSFKKSFGTIQRRRTIIILDILINLSFKICQKSFNVLSDSKVLKPQCHLSVVYCYLNVFLSRCYYFELTVYLFLPHISPIFHFR